MSTYDPQPGMYGLVYLAGPMRGLPEFNFPAFHAGEADLRALGWGVFNPAAMDETGGFDPTGMTGNEDLSSEGFDLRNALANDLEFITRKADAVAVLPGWEKSSGARAEVATAWALGLRVFRVDDWEDVPPPSAAPTTDEVRVTSATGGQKGQKEARYSLIPPGPLRELAVLYARGGIKYTDDNWKRGYSWSLSYDALRRHLDLWWSRAEDVDPEMGVKHLTNVAWHAFNLAWFTENRPEFDDRPGLDEVYIGAEPTPQWLLKLAETKAGE